MKLLFALVVLGAVLSLSAKDVVPAKPLALPVIIPPLPAVVAYAAAQQVAIDGIEATEANVAARMGDSITALVAFREGRRSKQWLVQFRIATPTEKEIADHPPMVLWMNSNTSGRKYEFGSGRVLALDIRTAGPFLEGQNPPETEKYGRTFISPDLLGMGLDGSCRAILKYTAAQAAASPAGAAGGAAPIVLSEEEERAAMGFVPALIAFFQGVQATPGLREILWEIAEKPSVWSIIKRGGKVDTNLNCNQVPAEADPTGWVLPGSALYQLPLAVELNSTPALNCMLLVTSSKPPLMTCAGIVGISAEPPGRKDKRLDVRIIAAHRATN